MNELLKELALEAKLGPALLLHYWGKVDALTDSEQEALEQIEKFAELIVRECADIDFYNLAGFDLHDHDRASQVIKEHFGVEE